MTARLPRDTRSPTTRRRTTSPRLRGLKGNELTKGRVDTSGQNPSEPRHKPKTIDEAIDVFTLDSVFLHPLKI